jgi:hypothetical protein
LLGIHTVCHTRGMHIPASDIRDKNHRVPTEIISHGVWLYFQPCLSYRDGSCIFTMPVISVALLQAVHPVYEVWRGLKHYDFGILCYTTG